MSSATTLIAVSLEELQAAIGSKSDDIRDRALQQASAATQQRAWPLKLEFLDSSELLMNGAIVSPESLKAELQKPEHQGVKLYCIERRTCSIKRRATVCAEHLAVIQDAMMAGIVSGWEWETPSQSDSDEELPLEQAIAELIDGKCKVSDTDLTFQYGYALESIVRTVGQHLATIEGDVLLTHLKLKTPLSRRRNPVKLPRSDDDVPSISYMTAEEVSREQERLRGIDMAFPASSEVESGRYEYAKAIDDAAAHGKAIVAFGY